MSGKSYKCLLFIIIFYLLELLLAGSPAAAEPASSSLEQPITICILDSGWNKEEAEGWNYLDNSSDLSDASGHGTLICQLLEELVPDARLIMLKCFQEEVENNSEENPLVQAIYDSVDEYQADIINMSWASTLEDPALHEAIQYASRQGVCLTAAAGNLSFQTPLGSKVYPAGWEEVIGVGGVNVEEDGTVASSVWYLSSEAVFVCADGNYKEEKGSSFAVPRVTAIIANYLEENPLAEEADVREYLKNQAADAGKEGYDTTFGWGYLKE